MKRGPADVTDANRGIGREALRQRAERAHPVVLEIRPVWAVDAASVASIDEHDVRARPHGRYRPLRRSPHEEP